MRHANCTINRHFSISPVDDRIFGSFIEHMGRAVYTGIYEPGHETADEQGFRKDVIDAIAELNVPIIRYPGGNFVSGYDWKDGIGPKENRPTRLDYAWLSIENNSFGIDEFVDWSKKAGTKGMIAVNLGTGTPKEAGELIEYCNVESGTYWSDLRIKNGHKEPHNFKTWCLGNEMDGPWQTGQLSAQDYAKKARETAKILKWVDPSIELVACGSSSAEMPTFPEWDRVVLETLYEHVDFLSLHRYYQFEGNIANFLGSFYDLDQFIQTIKATADYVKAKTRSKKTMYLSLDEWNVWYMKNMDVKRWQVAPGIAEDVYSLMDALVFGGLMCSLLNNADRVKMACLAQLVNALAPIHTIKGGGVLKHTTYYIFQQVSQYGRGEVIKNVMVCDKLATAKHGEIPALESLTIYNEKEKALNIFILNCHQEDDVTVLFDLKGFGELELIEHSVLTGNDLFAYNSIENPLNVVPSLVALPEVSGDLQEICLPQLSWNMMRFKCQ